MLYIAFLPVLVVFIWRNINSSSRKPTTKTPQGIELKENDDSVDPSTNPASDSKTQKPSEPNYAMIAVVILLVILGFMLPVILLGLAGLFQ